MKEKQIERLVWNFEVPQAKVEVERKQREQKSSPAPNWNQIATRIAVEGRSCRDEPNHTKKSHRWLSDVPFEGEKVNDVLTGAIHTPTYFLFFFNIFFITYFWVIPQIHFFSSKIKKYIFGLKTKKNPKNNNSEKRISERLENG